MVNRISLRLVAIIVVISGVTGGAVYEDMRLRSEIKELTRQVNDANAAASNTAARVADVDARLGYLAESVRIVTDQAFPPR